MDKDFCMTFLGKEGKNAARSPSHQPPAPAQHTLPYRQNRSPSKFQTPEQKIRVQQNRYYSSTAPRSDFKLPAPPTYPQKVQQRSSMIMANTRKYK
jgi:hypothetical protein